MSLGKKRAESALPAPRTRPPPAAITGIRRLDAEIVPADAPAHIVQPHIVFLHEPGMEAGAFLLHAATGTGGRVAYATTSRSAEAIQAELARLGEPMSRCPVDVIDLRDVKDAQEIHARIQEGSRTASTLAIESLTGIVHAIGETAAAAWYASTREAWRGRRLFAQLSDRAYEPGTRERLREADVLVRLVRREVLGVRHEAFQVARAGQRALGKRAVPYRIERPGGVHPVLSKILVTGAYSAGKSTLVHTLSEAGVNVEHLGTTVSLDHGRLELDGLAIELFGTPGQERFDPIIRQIGHGALGILAVLDSTRASTLHRARTLVDEIAGGGVPVVYAANKQDAPDALAPEAIRDRLGVGPDVPVLACRALDRESALAVLGALVERVLAHLAAPPTAPSA